MQTYPASVRAWSAGDQRRKTSGVEQVGWTDRLVAAHVVERGADPVQPLLGDVVQPGPGEPVGGELYGRGRGGRTARSAAGLPVDDGPPVASLPKTASMRPRTSAPDSTISNGTSTNAGVRVAQALRSKAAHSSASCASSAAASSAEPGSWSRSISAGVVRPALLEPLVERRAAACPRRRRQRHRPAQPAGQQLRVSLEFDQLRHRQLPRKRHSRASRLASRARSASSTSTSCAQRAARSTEPVQRRGHARRGPAPRRPRQRPACRGRLRDRRPAGPPAIGRHGLGGAWIRSVVGRHEPLVRVDDVTNSVRNGDGVRGFWVVSHT